ncbi:hypothetical protein BCO18430_03330 [Burkholderia contaminans]|uniref:SPW repeat protein n=1 Tax=Burkholderia contaminans TaxID=488447 RepID=UPI00145483E3|nr:SPW repeat protein [Burkholderia contaminans]VWC92279.1 hypothetical protein BCO18430_03330 [Burkholderia contaminans]
MSKRHWQDWVNLLLGLWMVVAPFTVAHVMATNAHPAGVTDIVMWNHYVVGIPLVALAIAALAAFAAWEEWLIIALGLWLLVSPGWFGFTSSTGLMWNSMVIGVLVALFAAWALVADRKTRQPT